jgi:hypothetical protein
MSVKLQDVVSNFFFPHWGAIPGRHILWEYKEVLGKSTENVDKLFTRYVTEKIPKARNLVDQLVQNRSVSDIHLPLQLSSIFLIFLDECVEHYQNQFEKRDLEIDEKHLAIKYLLGNNSDLPWENNADEVKSLFALLRDKLVIEEALPPHFDASIAIWGQILTIPNMGNIQLASLYEKSAQKNRICYEGGISESGHCETPLSRSVLQEALRLSVRQFSKNLNWLIPEMREKVPDLEDRNLEDDLRKIIFNDAHPDKDQSVSACFRKYESLMNIFINLLLRLNVDEPGAEYAEYAVCLRLIDEMMKNQSCIPRSWKIGDVAKGHDHSPIKLHDSLYKQLENYRQMYRQCRFYLNLPTIVVDKLMKALYLSDEAWKVYKETNNPPRLASQVPSLLAPIVEYQAPDDSWLETKSVGHPKPKKEKKNRTKTIVQVKTPLADSDEKPAGSHTASVPIISSIECLRSKLLHLHRANPSRALRQAAWHLDSLIVLQKSQKKDRECLALVTMVASSAQKVLEQTYRFCTRQDNASLARVHNLKTYHRIYDPHSTSYPSEVKKLFLANHWCRYFYTEYEKWDSLKTAVTAVPPLLSSLVEIAEGRNPSRAQLDSMIGGTIEAVHKHVEFMLQKQAQDNFQPIAFHHEPLALTTLLSGALFNSVSKKMGALLTTSKLNPHDPVHLRMKQILSALKMQSTCVENINSCKDISTFSTWTVWNLQQMQEIVEGALHCIEHLQSRQMSTDHEIKELAAKVKVEMGPLAEQFQNLSHKVRYPAEVLVNTIPARIIDDLEALKIHPEIMKGYALEPNPAILFADPSEGITPNLIAGKLNKFMQDTEEFLRMKALPALETGLKAKQRDLTRL